MTRDLKRLVGFLFTAMMLAGPSAAAVDPDAEIVELRLDCGTRDDCFETTAALVSWIGATRVPTAAAPLLVRAGPGEFGAINCDATPFSHVSFIGAGRETTRFVGPFFGVAGKNCSALEFIDLAVEGNVYSVVWTKGGSSQWTDVDMIGSWYDFSCGNPGDTEPVGVHYFYGSRVTASSLQSAVFSQCGDNWFYGSEVLYRPTPSSVGSPVAITVGARGQVRMFGSAVRLSTDLMPASDGDPTTINPYKAVFVGSGANGRTPGHGIFHMHGGIININASNLDEGDLTGIEVFRPAGGSAVGHTPDTAFSFLRPAAGSVTRVKGPAASPFLWQAGPVPPTSTGEVSELISEQGQDLYVETDCQSDGTCDDAASPGTEAHLMVYDSSCLPGDTWRNVVTGRCRNVLP